MNLNPNLSLPILPQSGGTFQKPLTLPVSNPKPPKPRRSPKPDARLRMEHWLAQQSQRRRRKLQPQFAQKRRQLDALAKRYPKRKGRDEALKARAVRPSERKRRHLTRGGWKEY